MTTANFLLGDMWVTTVNTCIHLELNICKTSLLQHHNFCTPLKSDETYGMLLSSPIITGSNGVTRYQTLTSVRVFLFLFTWRGANLGVVEITGVLLEISSPRNLFISVVYKLLSSPDIPSSKVLFLRLDCRDWVGAPFARRF